MIQPEPGPEQRRWTRHKIDVRLKLTYGAISAFGRGNTLSQGGMGAFIPCTIPLGTAVDLELSFPYSHAEVKIAAVVRSCEGFRYGLEFVRMPDEVRTVIIKNCDSAQLSN
jgi:hypothetical protein